MLESESPAAIASNAYLKLCRLDVNAETERWARTPPKFSVDGRVAVITINTGFQGEEKGSLFPADPHSTSCDCHSMGGKSGAQKQQTNHDHGEVGVAFAP